MSPELQASVRLTILLARLGQYKYSQDPQLSKKLYTLSTEYKIMEHLVRPPSNETMEILLDVGRQALADQDEERAYQAGDAIVNLYIYDGEALGPDELAPWLHRMEQWSTQRRDHHAMIAALEALSNWYETQEHFQLALSYRKRLTRMLRERHVRELTAIF